MFKQFLNAFGVGTLSVSKNIISLVLSTYIYIYISVLTNVLPIQMLVTLLKAVICINIEHRTIHHIIDWTHGFEIWQINETRHTFLIY